MSKSNKPPQKYTSQPQSAASVLSISPLNLVAGAAAIIFAIFLAYYFTINGGFLLDDDQLLTDNRLISAPDGLYKFWCTPEALDYWPISNSSLWIEWRLWRMNPAGYRIINLILHVAEVLLIWIILRKLSIPGAFLAALLFAVHPVNMESVAWISQRKNMLAMLFFLLSILWYLKAYRTTNARGYRQKHREQAPGLNLPASSFILHPSSFHTWYWLSLAAFVLAMLSKGSVAILPVLLLGVGWWLRPEGAVPIFSPKMRLSPYIRRDIVLTAPFFAVAMVLVYVNIWFQTHGSNEVIRTASFTERLLGAGGVVWFYLYKAFLPINLDFIYLQWHVSAGDPLWWLPLAAALAVTAVLWVCRKTWARPFLFAWGFFCVALIPVLGFINVGFMKHSLVADHYQHIAIIAVVALAAAGWRLWHRRTQGLLRWAAIAAAIAALVVCTAQIWRQSYIYCDEITLYRVTLKKNPNSWISHNNLGYLLAIENKGNWLPEVMEHFQKAVQINPNYPETHNNLANLLSRTGQIDESIRHYEWALRLKSDYPQAQFSLGLLLFKIGRQKEGIEHLQKAVRLSPNFLDARIGFGDALFRTGRLQEAVEQYQRTLSLNPNIPDVHNNLGTVLLKLNRMQEAIVQFRIALSLNPKYTQAYNNLGTALSRIGRSQDAIKCFERALRLQPDFFEARYNLGYELTRLARLPEAIEEFQKALSIKSDHLQTLNNLGVALVKVGRPEEAIEYYRRALLAKPDYVETYNNMGNAYQVLGLYQQSIESYENALRLYPDYAEAYNNLGAVLTQSGRFQEAIEHCRQALRLKPEFINAYSNMAVAYAGMRQSSEAIAAAEKALEIARAKHDDASVKRIENWLNSYRANMEKTPDTGAGKKQ